MKVVYTQQRGQSLMGRKWKTAVYRGNRFVYTLMYTHVFFQFALYTDAHGKWASVETLAFMIDGHNWAIRNTSIQQ